MGTYPNKGQPLWLGLSASIGLSQWGPYLGEGGWESDKSVFHTAHDQQENEKHPRGEALVCPLHTAGLRVAPGREQWVPTCSLSNKMSQQHPSLCLPPREPGG